VIQDVLKTNYIFISRILLIKIYPIGQSLIITIKKKYFLFNNKTRYFIPNIYFIYSLVCNLFYHVVLIKGNSNSLANK
jgi:hypothetical protein